MRGRGLSATKQQDKQEGHRSDRPNNNANHTGSRQSQEPMHW